MGDEEGEKEDGYVDGAHCGRWMVGRADSSISP